MDGYILKTVTLDGQRTVVIGGNDEPSSMYAAYDFLHRLGFVFLLTKDDYGDMLGVAVQRPDVLQGQVI